MMSLRNSLTGKVSVCILLLALAGCLAMPSTSWAILHVSCDAGEGDPLDGHDADGSDGLGGGSLPPDGYDTDGDSTPPPGRIPAFYAAPGLIDVSMIVPCWDGTKLVFLHIPIIEGMDP